MDNGLLSVDNGVDKIVDADASLVAKEYYTSYSKYVLEYRALPSVYDGLKPVQRRIIYTACQYPQKLMKTAKMSGLVMAYHPHGSSSISGAINEMAHPLNVLPLFTTKGNFGGVGFGPSADRYTELYLSEVARKNFCQFIDYADYEVGEIGENEPSSLPSLIPYCLFKGSEGIGIGLSTKVMPLNLIDLIDYYIEYIKNDGKTKKFIRPDVGYVLLDMNDDEIRESVSSYKGKITAISTVTQISSTTFLLEGLFDKSIDAVISKIDRWKHWFSQDKVGFRDASTTSLKYVFEIYDSSITPEEFVDAMTWATRKSNTFTRVLEEDGNAVYSSFNHVVKKSLECLNKAIDRKISSEISKSQSQLDLYNVLNICKSKGTFDNIVYLDSVQLINAIVRDSGCSIELAGEVIKKPMSYLTRSHDSEIKGIEDRLTDLKNHDRKKFLVDLYKDFRRSVIPIYENKKHTLTKNDLVNNPCIKFKSHDDISITDGDGEEFNSTVYFISDKGYIYKRCISKTSKASIIVETSCNDKIVGLVTDKFNYIEVVTRFKYSGWEGRSIIKIDSIPYDKQYFSLREDDEEHIVEINGINVVDDKYSGALRSSRTSKTKFYRI